MLKLKKLQLFGTFNKTYDVLNAKKRSERGNKVKISVIKVIKLPDSDHLFINDENLDKPLAQIGGNIDDNKKIEHPQNEVADEGKKKPEVERNNNQERVEQQHGNILPGKQNQLPTTDKRFEQKKKDYNTKISEETVHHGNSVCESSTEAPGTHRSEACDKVEYLTDYASEEAEKVFQKITSFQEAETIPPIKTTAQLAIQPPEYQSTATTEKNMHDNELRNKKESEFRSDSERIGEDYIYSKPLYEYKTSSEEGPSESIITSNTLYNRRSRIQPVRHNVDDGVPLTVYSKSEEEKKRLRGAIEKNELLSRIVATEGIKNSIIDAMYEKRYKAKDIIIKQGDKGAHMYISAKGRYQIIIKGQPFEEFSDSRVFGELAILHKAPRQATVKALTNGRVWVLDQHAYHQITVGYYIRTQDEIMGVLMKSQKLKVAGKAVLQMVANILKTEIFAGGEQIVCQGDPGDTFFIVLSGTVTITRAGEGVVGVCKQGDCFGELALLQEITRQATVTADPPRVECLTLTREQFVKYFGEIRSFTEFQPYENRSSVHIPASEYSDIELGKLRFVATLGVGGFGRVDLVQHEDDKSLVFALKYLKKYDIVADHQEEHICNERSIHMACSSPFIIRMYRTFRNNKFVYFLMEPCLGGDVVGLMKKQNYGRFAEIQARFIAASVVEALEYLHARNIIFRDLKPENLLVSANGYMKLSDFGLAKKMTSTGKTFTFAGTPEYIAPEIILNKGQDRAVDYWTLGIFIYEMLRGVTPFRSKDGNRMKIYTKMLKGIDYADFTSVTPKARHLIEKLCRPVPAYRLGMQNSGIKDIKNHTWFLGFEWEKLRKCEMYSPFKPHLKSPIDTSFIDKFERDNDTPPDEASGWDDGF